MALVLKLKKNLHIAIIVIASIYLRFVRFSKKEAPTVMGLPFAYDLTEPSLVDLARIHHEKTWL
jgi:hypothetical protein